MPDGGVIAALEFNGYLMRSRVECDVDSLVARHVSLGFGRYTQLSQAVIQKIKQHVSAALFRFRRVRFAVPRSPIDSFSSKGNPRIVRERP